MPDQQASPSRRVAGESSQSRAAAAEASRGASERAALATLLYQVGAALLAMFVLLAVLGSLPLALGQPEWIERISSNLQNLGLTALSGSVFIVLSQGIDRSDRKLRSRVTLVRKLAIWAMLGWLLLIPLQLSASYNMVRQGLRSQNEQLVYFRKVQKRLELARNQQDLRSAIALVPGTPTDFTITNPVPEVARQLSEQMGRRIKAAETALQKENDQRLQNFSLVQARTVLYSLLLALAFAAIAQSSPGSPSMLNRLLNQRWLNRLLLRWRL